MKLRDYLDPTSTRRFVSNNKSLTYWMLDCDVFAPLDECMLIYLDYYNLSFGYSTKIIEPSIPEISVGRMLNYTYYGYSILE